VTLLLEFTNSLVSSLDLPDVVTAIMRTRGSDLLDGEAAVAARLGMNRAVHPGSSG